MQPPSRRRRPWSRARRTGRAPPHLADPRRTCWPNTDATPRAFPRRVAPAAAA